MRAEVSRGRDLLKWPWTPPWLETYLCADRALCLSIRRDGAQLQEAANGGD